MPIDPAFADLVPDTARLRRLASGAAWAEGPTWLPDGSVLWSDIPNDRVLRWSPAGGPDVFLDPAGFQNGRTIDLDGGILACSHGDRRVERLGLDGSRTSLVDRYRGARLNSPNDLVVKSDGSIWFTDPPYGIISDYEGHKAESEIGDCLVFRFDPGTGELDAVSDWVEEPERDRVFARRVAPVRRRHVERQAAGRQRQPPHRRVRRRRQPAARQPARVLRDRTGSGGRIPGRPARQSLHIRRRRHPRHRAQTVACWGGCRCPRRFRTASSAAPMARACSSPRPPRCTRST